MSHSFCLCKISKNRFALTKFVQMQLRCKSGFSPAGHHSHYCLHRVSKNRLLWLVLRLLKTAAKREESFSRMHTRMLQMCGVVAQHSRRLHFSINMRELQIYFIHSHWQLKPRAPIFPSRCASVLLVSAQKAHQSVLPGFVYLHHFLRCTSVNRHYKVNDYY